MVYVHAVPCGGDVEPERRGGQCSWGGRGFGVGRELRASPAAGSVFSLYCLFMLEEERMKQPQVLIHLQIILFQLGEWKTWFWALFLAIYGLFELGYMNSYSNIFPVSFPGLLGGCIGQCLWKCCTQTVKHPLGHHSHLGSCFSITDTCWHLSSWCYGFKWVSSSIKYIVLSIYLLLLNLFIIKFIYY